MQNPRLARSSWGDGEWLSASRLGEECGAQFQHLISPFQNEYREDLLAFILLSRNGAITHS
jgi:hypothetical protein